MFLHKSLSARLVVLGCYFIGGLFFFSPSIAGISPVSELGSVKTSLAQSQKQIMTSYPQGSAPYYLKNLALLYAARHMQQMWQDQRAVRQFQQQLVEVAISGVQPQFSQWIKLLTDSRVSGFTRDVVLSDAMLGYLQFISSISSKGEVWLYGNVPYKLEVPSMGAINKWQRALSQEGLSRFVQSLAPQHPQYARMYHALKILLADTRQWPKLTDTQTLRPGNVSDDVPALRDILQRTGMMLAENELPEPISEVADTTPLVHNVQPNGETALLHSNDDMVLNFLSQPTRDITVSSVLSTVGNMQTNITLANAKNVYTPQLVKALKRFQRWQGLEADGSIGRRTRQWLNVSPRLRASLLALNIQRLRLLPEDMNNRIMVNIPNYSLAYYVNGNEILSSRVIVGRPDRKTPLMSSSLNNVVLNPPWNVPTTLVRKDILPKIKRDPMYLYKHRYTLLSDWSNDAHVINPMMISWDVVSTTSFPYRVRQEPGATNSLGRYKFNMPNSDAIYLHATPDQGLFRKDMRALSSGCIRVNRASDLANLLLQDAGWNETRIDNTLKQGKTRYVPIRHRIPVNLYYLTAWVADNGQPQFRTDIYNYDNTARSGMQALASTGQLLLY